jgi:hypothetical protein
MNLLQLSVLTAGTGLELALLLFMFRRGVARLYPIFASLIVFYIARSLALFFLFGHMSTENYMDLNNVLSWVDLCIQLLVVCEISFRLLRERRKGSGGQPALFAATLVAVVTAIVVAGGVFRPGMHTDRSTAVVALLMLFLGLWTVFAHFGGVPRYLALGFAAFGLLSVGADLVRREASLHRNASLWMVGSWLAPGAWVAVLIFWLFALKSRNRYQPAI